MATPYSTPGVYIEEVPNLPRSVAEVETAIPAFIGYTQVAQDENQQSLITVPTRITSLLEYETYFGTAQSEKNLQVTYTEFKDTANGPTTNESIAVAFSSATGASLHNLYYSVAAYFANGGGPCYIVSVGLYKTPFGGALDPNDFSNPADATKLHGLDAIAREDEPTLLVFPEGQNLPSAAAHYALLGSALDQCGTLQNRFVIMDLHDTAAAFKLSADVTTAATAFRSGVTPGEPENLKYGAAYFPNVIANFSYAFNDADVTVIHNVMVGGVLQSPALANTTLAALQTSNSALYNKLESAVGTFPVVLPPSPLMAGVYASVDSDRGVWKAPANVGLANVIGLTFKITNDLQDGLNIDPVSGKSINCIRAFTGNGIRVWGARTLDGNDNEWRYVNVRRFFIMVEQSCKLATFPFVFEPNDANTWAKVQAMIENFLTTLWRQGALQGAKPEQAFYVQIGLGITMTALDVLEGRMIVEIGMAAVRPAEFIILRFVQTLPQS